MTKFFFFFVNSFSSFFSGFMTFFAWYSCFFRFCTHFEIEIILKKTDRQSTNIDLFIFSAFFKKKMSYFFDMMYFFVL
jgi:hypothetical protein